MQRERAENLNLRKRRTESENSFSQALLTHARMQSIGEEVHFHHVGFRGAEMKRVVGIDASVSLQCHIGLSMQIKMGRTSDITNRFVRAAMIYSDGMFSMESSVVRG